jgi:hypothetical protein
METRQVGVKSKSKNTGAIAVLNTAVAPKVKKYAWTYFLYFSILEKTTLSLVPTNWVRCETAMRPMAAMGQKRRSQL